MINNEDTSSQLIDKESFLVVLPQNNRMDNEPDPTHSKSRSAIFFFTTIGNNTYNLCSFLTIFSHFISAFNQFIPTYITSFKRDLNGIFAHKYS